jgi:predicted DNA-binding antitoxin AbrB/MazE fold protein
MVRHVDAIFREGAFQPVEPLVLPEGTRVHLRVEEQEGGDSKQRPAKIHTPKLANAKDAADFVMEVRETGDAGV